MRGTSGDDFTEHAGVPRSGGLGQMIDFAFDRAQSEESESGRLFGLGRHGQAASRGPNWPAPAIGPGRHGHALNGENARWMEKAGEMPHQRLVQSPAAAHDDFGRLDRQKTPVTFMDRICREVGERGYQIQTSYPFHGIRKKRLIEEFTAG